MPIGATVEPSTGPAFDGEAVAGEESDGLAELPEATRSETDDGGRARRSAVARSGRLPDDAVHAVAVGAEEKICTDAEQATAAVVGGHD